MAGLTLPGFTDVKKCRQHIYVVESQLCSQREFLAAPDFLQLVKCHCCFSNLVFQFMINVTIIIDAASMVCKVFHFFNFLVVCKASVGIGCSPANMFLA